MHRRWRSGLRAPCAASSPTPPGRETSRRSAMRAWITSISSSRSSQIASQYSSNAGWNSLDRSVATSAVYARRLIPSFGSRPSPLRSADLGVRGGRYAFRAHVRRVARAVLRPGSGLVRVVVRGADQCPDPGPGGRSRPGEHTLLCAPTGSGKTLAAFLWAIDALGRTPPARPGVRVLYISPLRALAVDIDKNLRAPLRGIRMAAERLGQPFVEPTVGVRTGDTTRGRASVARAAPARHPDHHARIAVPDAHVGGPRDAARSRERDHRRDPRAWHRPSGARISR